MTGSPAAKVEAQRPRGLEVRRLELMRSGPRATKLSPGSDWRGGRAGTITSAEFSGPAAGVAGARGGDLTGGVRPQRSAGSAMPVSSPSGLVHAKREGSKARTPLVRERAASMMAGKARLIWHCGIAKDAHSACCMPTDIYRVATDSASCWARRTNSNLISFPSTRKPVRMPYWSARIALICSSGPAPGRAMPETPGSQVNNCRSAR